VFRQLFAGGISRSTGGRGVPLGNSSLPVFAGEPLSTIIPSGQFVWKSSLGLTIPDRILALADEVID
jgi:hypothetical protein